MAALVRAFPICGAILCRLDRGLGASGAARLLLWGFDFTRADELAKRLKSGENFAAAAKALSFEVKTSEPLARTGSLPEAGSMKQFSAAFKLPVGQSGDPVFLGTTWVVYRVAQHDPINEDDFAKQKTTIEAQALQSRRQAAYELFRTTLEARLRQEGKLHINEENLKRLTRPA